MVGRNKFLWDECLLGRPAALESQAGNLSQHVGCKASASESLDLLGNPLKMEIHYLWGWSTRSRTYNQQAQVRKPLT